MASVPSTRRPATLHYHAYDYCMMPLLKAGCNGTTFFAASKTLCAAAAAITAAAGRQNLSTTYLLHHAAGPLCLQLFVLVL
jgi:hypothetical protein